MQAWGTVLGAIFAAVATIGAFLLYWHERSTRRDDERDREIAQARTLIVRVAPAAMTDNRTITRLRFSIINYGSAPILNVVLRVGLTRIEPSLLGEPPWWRHLVLGPGEEAAVERDLPTPMFVTGHDIDLESTLYKFVSFTDSSGLMWARENNRQPKRVLVRKERRCLWFQRETTELPEAM